MAFCKACQSVDISCNGCIFADHFSKQDQIQDLEKLISEFSYHGLKLRLRQIISENKSVSVYVSDVLKIFEGINTKVSSGCVCTDDSAISKIVDCNSCVLGRVFTHPDQSGCLEMLVKHFSSVAIFKRYLEVMEHTHGIDFTKFYVKAMYREIIQVNTQIESLQNVCEVNQRKMVSIDEKITVLKEKCVYYQNECNKLNGYTTPGATDAGELYDKLESEYRYDTPLVTPRSVPPGFGRFRVVRPPKASAAGGPSRQSIRSPVPRTRVYVSSEDSDSDPDYDPDLEDDC